MRLLRPLQDIFVADRGSRQRAAEYVVAALVGVGWRGLIVSHESVIAALKRLTNKSILTTSPEEHVDHTRRESDRAAIILFAGMIENFVLEKLRERMPGLNADEQARLFSFEGPCGSFSNRLRMAQALGMIDRSARKKLEIIKELRNTAAHSHLEITFDTPEVKDAVKALFPPEEGETCRNFPRDIMRMAFESVCGDAVMTVADDNRTSLDTADTFKKFARRLVTHAASLGISSEASPQNRPAKAKKGKRPPRQPAS